MAFLARHMLQGYGVVGLDQQLDGFQAQLGSMALKIRRVHVINLVDCVLPFESNTQCTLADPGSKDVLRVRRVVF